jgi:hypothetical protein
VTGKEVIMRFRPSLALSLAVACFAAATVRAQKGPALPDVLQAAATYLIDYSQKLGAVETEEALTQRETSAGTFGTGHTWKAELVLLGLGNGDFAAFRDVFDVENSKARERDSRLLHLFREDPAQALREAQKLDADSGRLALAPAMTAFNSPTLGLAFLRKENQARSSFKLDSVKTMNGVQVAILKFSEQTKPHLLQGTDDGTLQGRLWVEAASGIVRQTELLFTSPVIDVRANTNFGLEPKLGIWVPVSLDSRYEMTSGGAGPKQVGQGNQDNTAYRTHQTIECQVKFSKFQQVPVDVSKFGK